MFLAVADRFAEISPHLSFRIQGAHRQQGDFEVEVDFGFDDDFAGIGAAAGFGVIPRSCNWSALFTIDWPLPDEDMVGLTKQG